MNLPTNNDFENRELSIEELEAIAAAGWLGDAWHWVEHKASQGLDLLGSNLMTVVNTIVQSYQQRGGSTTTTVNRRMN